MSSMYNQNYLRYSFSFKDTCSKSTMKTTDHLLLVWDSYLLKRLIPKTDETDTYGNSHRKYYIKHVFLKYLQISQKAPVLESPFRPANLLKETPIQVFSCEICKIFKNTLFEKHLQMTASAIVAFMGSFMGLARDRLKKVLRFWNLSFSWIKKQILISWLRKSFENFTLSKFYWQKYNSIQDTANK